MKFIYFTVLLLSFNGHSFGELTSEQNDSLVLIKQEINRLRNKNDKSFLYYLNSAIENVSKLNKQAIGFKSDTIEEAAKKILKYGSEIASSFKIKDNLVEQDDINALGDKLKNIDNEFNAIKDSLINKKFATEKRQQASNIIIEMIKILEEPLDDAIASVPSY